MKDEVGITIATHGWIGTEMTRGKFMVEEGAEMQWKEEREVYSSLMTLFKFGLSLVNPRAITTELLKYFNIPECFLTYFTRYMYLVVLWRSLQS